MSVISGRTLVTDALTDLAVLGIGRPLSGRDGALGLRYLQELIDSAELDPAVISAVARTAYTLVASTENRMIGPTGNYVQARPLWLAGAFVKAVGSNEETELDRLSRAEWLRIPDKTIEAELPSAIYLEPTITNATLHFFPVPTTAGTLVVATPTALTGFSGTLDVDYTLLPGYLEWFRLKLRNKLARPFTKPLTEDMREEERAAWRAIERVNDQGPPRMMNDYPPERGAAYDITTNRYVVR